MGDLFFVLLLSSDLIKYHNVFLFSLWGCNFDVHVSMCHEHYLQTCKCAFLFQFSNHVYYITMFLSISCWSCPPPLKNQLWWWWCLRHERIGGWPWKILQVTLPCTPSPNKVRWGGMHPQRRAKGVREAEASPTWERCDGRKVALNAVNYVLCLYKPDKYVRLPFTLTHCLNFYSIYSPRHHWKTTLRTPVTCTSCIMGAIEGPAVDYKCQLSSEIEVLLVAMMLNLCECSRIQKRARTCIVHTRPILYAAFRCLA